MPSVWPDQWTRSGAPARSCRGELLHRAPVLREQLGAPGLERELERVLADRVRDLGLHRIRSARSPSGCRPARMPASCAARRSRCARACRPARRRTARTSARRSACSGCRGSSPCRAAGCRDRAARRGCRRRRSRSGTGRSGRCRVGAVVEQDAHVADALRAPPAASALAFDDAADQHRAAAEERLLHPHGARAAIRDEAGSAGAVRHVDRVARPRARGDLDHVADHDRGVGRQRGDPERERPAVRPRERRIGRAAGRRSAWSPSGSGSPAAAGR